MNITIVSFQKKKQYNTIRIVPIVKFVFARLLLKQEQKHLARHFISYQYLIFVLQI